jgi:hypothetical protein
MSEMVERVARAIRARKFERTGKLAVLDRDLPPTDNELDDARAAIEAMREPLEAAREIVEAYRDAADYASDHSRNGLVEMDRADKVLALLDAALQRHERRNADSSEAG